MAGSPGRDLPDWLGRRQRHPVRAMDDARGRRASRDGAPPAAAGRDPAGALCTRGRVSRARGRPARAHRLGRPRPDERRHERDGDRARGHARGPVPRGTAAAATRAGALGEAARRLRPRRSKPRSTASTSTSRRRPAANTGEGRERWQRARQLVEDLRAMGDVGVAGADVGAGRRHGQRRASGRGASAGPAAGGAVAVAAEGHHRQGRAMSCCGAPPPAACDSCRRQSPFPSWSTSWPIRTRTASCG